MGENEKPHICKVLGVAVNEKFRLVSNEGASYRVDQHGLLWMARSDNAAWSEDNVTRAKDLVEAINNPAQIVKVPRWSEKDKADAEAIAKILPAVKEVSRDENQNVSLILPDGSALPIAAQCFPSVTPGERVTIAEILGEKPSEEAEQCQQSES